MTLARAALVIGTFVFLSLSGTASASGARAANVCYEVADLYAIEVVCEYDAHSLDAAQEAAPAAKWVVNQLCKDGTSGGVEACSNPRSCTIDGRVGTLYAVFRDGERVGIACLTASEAVGVETPPIRTLVLRAFTRLDWPASDLVVQPPDGRTLVNLETNFYTENVASTNISVRLLGTDVVVTASPIAYRWHFGDGTTTTTSSPGAPYPDLDVAHVYKETGEAVVSVDTQYGNASFTVGGGAPESIPSTIWVTGADQELAIVEALPQLVLE